MSDKQCSCPVLKYASGTKSLLGDWWQMIIIVVRQWCCMDGVTGRPSGYTRTGKDRANQRVVRDSLA
jgi:hypothetical protein